jgi:hypothetical protein
MVFEIGTTPLVGTVTVPAATGLADVQVLLV